MTDKIILQNKIMSFIAGAISTVFIIAAIGSAIAAISAENSRITNLGTPTASTDAATKAYVDAGSLNPANWTCTVRTATESDSTASSYICTPTASCTGSEKMITGGCENMPVPGSDAGVSYQDSYPAGQGWNCDFRTSSGPCSVTAYANCCA